MKRLATTLAITALALLGAVSVPGAAHAGGTEPEVTCEYAGFNTGRALTNGDHVNMDIVQDGKKFQLNAYVDRNIQGGYDTLGIRINGHDPIPLTEAQVKAGAFTFNYPEYIDTTKPWKVVWVQFEAQYFNQDRNPAKFLNCAGEPPVVPEKPLPVTETKRTETKDCEAKVILIRDTTTTTDWKLVDNVWVQDLPTSSYIDSTSPVTASECPLPEIPDVGVDTAGLLWTLGGGLALVGTGVALTVKRRKNA